MRIAEEGVRRLATVVRDSNDAVLLQDFKGKILAWNHGAQVMFGYSEAEAIRLNALDLIPPVDRPAMQSILEHFKRGEDATTSIETRRITKDGRIIDVWLTITLLCDDEGRPIGIATTKRDITERKRSQKAMMQLNESLEFRVRERTATIEQQAIHLRELAAQLLTAEEEERRNLAEELHDNLSQILQVAKIKLSMFRKELAPSQIHGLAEVEKFLDQANQSARSLTYQLSPPILHELGLIPALQWLAEETKRQYKLNVSVKILGTQHSLGERTKAILFRAVRELLVNVAKHSGVSNAQVRVHGFDDRVKVTVEDRGKGFNTGLLESRTGSGFGLFSIGQRLQYVGGKMIVASARRKKTTVTLIMPVVEKSRDLPSESIRIVRPDAEGKK